MYSHVLAVIRGVYIFFSLGLKFKFIFSYCDEFFKMIFLMNICDNTMIPQQWICIYSWTLYSSEFGCDLFMSYHCHDVTLTLEHDDD